MAFINIWCIAAMLWLAFDRAFYEQYTLRRTKIEMEMRKRNMKIIKGGKE
jgi:hypothetical protein